MNRRRFLNVAAAVALPLPGPAPAGRLSYQRLDVALVLGGGGCRGYGHIGVIRVLEKHGLRLDLVVGSSAGSLVGALYAAGLDADRLEQLGDRLTPNLLRDWIFPKLGIFGGDAIRRFVTAAAGERAGWALLDWRIFGSGRRPCEGSSGANARSEIFSTVNERKLNESIG